MVRKAARPDLGAMLELLARQVVAAEQPILAAHGLSMWGYIVLSALDHSPIRTQAALAEAIGADKTRIIPTLDELQERGYMSGFPTPTTVARACLITASGRSIKNASQVDIQRGEEQWLGRGQPTTEPSFCGCCSSSVSVDDGRERWRDPQLPQNCRHSD